MRIKYFIPCFPFHCRDGQYVTIVQRRRLSNCQLNLKYIEVDQYETGTVEFHGPDVVVHRTDDRHHMELEIVDYRNQTKTQAHVEIVVKIKIPSGSLLTALEVNAVDFDIVTAPNFYSAGIERISLTSKSGNISSPKSHGGDEPISFHDERHFNHSSTASRTATRVPSPSVSDRGSFEEANRGPEITAIHMGTGNVRCNGSGISAIHMGRGTVHYSGSETSTRSSDLDASMTRNRNSPTFNHRGRKTSFIGNSDTGIIQTGSGAQIIKIGSGSQNVNLGSGTQIIQTGSGSQNVNLGSGAQYNW